MQRTPAQLDLPLADRLANAEPAPHPPGPAPEDLHPTITAKRLYVEWKAPRTTFAAGIAVLLVLFGFSVWLVMQRDYLAIGLPLVAFAVVLLITTVKRSRGRGANELEIANGQIAHTTHFPTTRVAALATEDLEHIRTHPGTPSTVSLISDDHILDLPGTPAQCHWIQAAIEHWLAQPTTIPRAKCSTGVRASSRSRASRARG